jgi:hypothetical protein
MRKKQILIFAFLLLFCRMTTLSAEYTLEELNQMRDLNLISIDDYEVLKAELLQGSAVQENLYTLKIGGKKLSNSYEIFWEEGKQYLAVEEFFSAINFTNFYPKASGMEIYLGELLEKIELKDGKVFRDGKEIVKDGEYRRYILKDEKIFIEKEIFQELFLSNLREDTQKSEINMELSFTPPVAIDQLLDISLAKLERENEKQELVFTGKRELFNLGYLRVEAGNSWTRTEEEKSYKSEWDGSLSYQGGLLYGGFQFDYDLKEKEFSNFRLDYDQIWKNHSLEISKSNFDSDGEWGFHFYKDKGYYNIGDTIVIRERVPVGSRAELLYMGTPIAIEDEENGEVIFSNNMIRSDRDYQLKIYYPDGKIIMKDIRTSEDYNRQQKGEMEYDISLNENSSENGYTTNINFYYGITDKFTFGAGINRDIIKNDSLEKDYMTTVNTELTYGDTLNGYSYTLQLNGERTLDHYYDDSFRNLEDRNQWGYLAEVTKNKWRTKFEQTKYAEYYDEKEDNNFEVSYDVTDSLRLDYSYSSTKYRTDEFGETKSKDKSSSIGVSYDKTIGGILIGSSIDLDLEDSKNNEYSINAYYSGFKSFTTRLENTWTNNGEDYEVSLNLYNNNLGGFLDVSAEVRYSNIEKETFGLTFSMTLDSWFKFDIDGDEHGNNNVRVGIDRIIDLKNPKLEVDNMDVSRAKIITFVDQNNNNMYDKGEPRVEGVEVKLGTHRVVTDKNGEANLYNLSNGIIYELQPTIKKPSYTMGNNVIKLQSNFSSDVDVLIPIKPMMNLTGYVNLDETLGIKENERDEFYSNIIIQILDMKGKEIDLASPDNTGYFDISGLFPEEYLIKVYYIGDNYNILNLNEKIVLKYDEDNGFDFDIQFNITNEQIEMLEKQNLAQLEEERVAKLKQQEGVRK